MTQTIQVNGISISYEVAGEGPWLLFSHSLGCSKTMWQSQFDLLAESFQVVRYDTRGHGQTDAPAGPYSLAMLADDVKGLCDALGIAQCHFVGLSMGGMIGQTVALKYPELLLSLTLADTSSYYGPAVLPMWQTRSQTALTEGMAALVTPSMERWFTASFREAQPELMQEVRQWIVETPAHGYAACCLALAALDTTARLKEISVPTLIIVGAEDAATPPAMSETMHAQIAGSQLVVLPSAAHIASVEQADAFNEALQEFLAEARA